MKWCNALKLETPLIIIIQLIHECICTRTFECTHTHTRAHLISNTFKFIGVKQRIAVLLLCRRRGKVVELTVRWLICYGKLNDFSTRTHHYQIHKCIHTVAHLFMCVGMYVRICVQARFPLLSLIKSSQSSDSVFSVFFIISFLIVIRSIKLFG